MVRFSTPDRVLQTPSHAGFRVCRSWRDCLLFGNFQSTRAMLAAVVFRNMNRCAVIITMWDRLVVWNSVLIIVALDSVLLRLWSSSCNSVLINNPDVRLQWQTRAIVTDSHTRHISEDSFEATRCIGHFS